MPFKSKAQQRFFFAAEERGNLPKGTARRWAKETSNMKSLPERINKEKKKASYNLLQMLILQNLPKQKKAACKTNLEKKAFDPISFGLGSGLAGGGSYVYRQYEKDPEKVRKNLLKYGLIMGLITALSVTSSVGAHNMLLNYLNRDGEG